jgi:DNA-binding NtrC family response regulator
LAASTGDLEKEISEGQFRQDLYRRLNACTIFIPPLRERGADKVILAKYYLQKLSRAGEGSWRRFDNETVRAIDSYDWPGNVREMINKIRTALVLSEGTDLRAEDIGLAPSWDIPERQYLREDSI